MTYRTANLDRSYVCPGCDSAERAPLQGGQVACSRCGARHVLPDRRDIPVSLGTLQAIPPDDPARLRHLRVQPAYPRPAQPTLQTMLGGMNVQAGREQEAIAIWQTLRARSQRGDVSASEDLTMLTGLLGRLPAMTPHPQFCEALAESAYDAAVLPRQRQEQLGYLVRAAVGRGDRARAEQYLGWMVWGAPDLGMDSEARTAAATTATLEGDTRRALALLGPRKDAVPMTNALAPLASVLRANAYEVLGDVAVAAQILRELPYLGVLESVTMQLPALKLCARSGPAYAAAATLEAAKPAAADTETTLGVVMGIFLGLFGLPTFFASRGAPLVIRLIVPAIFGILGFAIAGRSYTKGKSAAWLRTNGIPLTARILSVRLSRDSYRFTVEVAGPQGPYTATFDALVPSGEATHLIGTQIRVRAKPSNLRKLISETDFEY